jgi:hypothetical protein
MRHYREIPRALSARNSGSLAKSARGKNGMHDVPSLFSCFSLYLALLARTLTLSQDIVAAGKA